jgi:hypothetical protein
MRNYKLYLTVGLMALSAMSISSCTDKFEEYNTNPTKLTELDASGVGNAFAAAQYRGLTASWQTYQSLFGDLQSQYFANVAQNFPSDRNVMVGNWLNGAWGTNGFYGSAVPPLLGVLENTKPGGKAANPAIFAMANIWKVRMFLPRTDYWGPIPYSQVGNGEKSVEYDAQDVIYKDFLALLKKGAADLAPFAGKNVLGNNDQIYGGNVNNWILFANTLRLRIAMRMSVVEPALAKAEAESAVAGGVLTINAQDAFLKVTAFSINTLNQATAWNEFRMSSAMESVLKGYGDPRISKFYAPVPGTSNFKGLRNGYTQVELGRPENAASANSNVNDAFLPANQDKQPFGVMMSAEAWFLRAEGALKGWNMGAGTARTFYENGIANSMRQWGISDGVAVSAYTNGMTTPMALTDAVNTPALTNITVSWSTDPAKQIEQVLTQKWLALYPDGLEAWAEYRRTGFPKLYARINSESLVVPANGIVRRTPYVVGETQTNPKGVASGVAKLGGADNEATRLWWNK